MNNVAIFPLSTVLFPDGVLSLRIFETRYLDMVSNCLKKDIPFGVSMIVEGQEVGKAARCYEVGTLAKIINWDQSANGLLQIEAIGCQRFRILNTEVSKGELITASINVLDDLPVVPVPEELFELVDILKKVLKKGRVNISFDTPVFNDANWVGCRLTEVLPLEEAIRQRLLEIDDPIERLHMILGLFAAR